MWRIRLNLICGISTVHISVIDHRRGLFRPAPTFLCLYHKYNSIKQPPISVTKCWLFGKVIVGAIAVIIELARKRWDGPEQHATNTAYDRVERGAPVIACYETPPRIEWGPDWTFTWSHAPRRRPPPTTSKTHWFIPTQEKIFFCNNIAIDRKRNFSNKWRVINTFQFQDEYFGVQEGARDKKKW